MPDLIRDIERVDTKTVESASRFPSSILAGVAGRNAARGRRAEGVWGPLHGVPMKVKESFDVVGVQIIGPQFADRTCIDFAKSFEQEYRGFVRHPAMSEAMSRESPPFIDLYSDTTTRSADGMRRCGFIRAAT